MIFEIFILVYITSRQWYMVSPYSQVFCKENNVRNVFCLTDLFSIPFRYWLLISSMGSLLQRCIMYAAVVLSV